MQPRFKNPWWGRILFGLLLFTFGELIAWGDGGRYSSADWLAVLCLYLVLGAASLDLIVRFRTYDLKTVLMVAGIYGIVRTTLMSPPDMIRTDDFVVNLIFMPLGVQVIMFLLAYLSFQFLGRGEASGMWDFFLAAIIGFGFGTWLRWFPQIDGVQVAAIPLSEGLPLVITALLWAGLFPFLLQCPPRMKSNDWHLSPYEWAFVGVIIIVGTVVRYEAGYIDQLEGSINGMFVLAFFFMIAFTRRIRKQEPLKAITPPKPPHLVGWGVLFLPLIAGALIAYEIIKSGNEPPHAFILFRALFLFGLLWVPIASIIIGFQVTTQIAREEG